mgnify:CR=1 FL=1
MEANLAQLQSCMYQYSRAIYRSIKDLIDPYVDQPTRLEYRRAVLCECEETMTRLAQDPHYFARPDRTLFHDIRRYFPITAQAKVAWATCWAKVSGSLVGVRGSSSARCSPGPVFGAAAPATSSPKPTTQSTRPPCRPRMCSCT